MQSNTNRKTSIKANPRNRRHAAGLVLAAGLLTPANGQDISWIGASGMWNDPVNWSLGRPPQSDEIIRIGNLPGVANNTVSMSYPGSGYGRLELSSGMTLDTNGGELISFGQAWLSGASTRLIVRPQPLGPNSSDFIGELHLGVGSFLDLRDNAPVTLWSGSASQGTITGRGYLKLGNNFPNTGVIRPGNNGGLVIDAGWSQELAIDLDGTGEGHLQLDTPFSLLEVNAEQLTDPFSGTINFAPGAALIMNIAQGWAADSQSTTNVAGFGNPAAESAITGSPLDFGGTMNVGAAEGRLRLHNATTFLSTAQVNVGPTDRLTTQGDVVVEGGTFSVGQGGHIDFIGATTMEGGIFTTASDSLVDGGVFFNGPTDWQGDVTFNGAAQQNSDATVSGSLGASINAGLFDMDGTNGGNTWLINAPLTISADRIGTIPENIIDAEISVAGGFLPRLTINLTDPKDSWVLAGSLSLSGTSPFYDTRLSGSNWNMQGHMSVTGLVQVSANTTFRDAGVIGNANVNIGSGDSLRMQGDTLIQVGVDFIGAGDLVNGTPGTMLMADGVSLNSVGLTNNGWLEIGEEAGIAGVSRFTQGVNGVWDVSIGGKIPGLEHDQLRVATGTAELDGTLKVSLLNGFEPKLGDKFTILTATSITAVFKEAEAPPLPSGMVMEVVYSPTRVVVEFNPGCYADCDQSTGAGVLDVFDFLCFQNSFVSGEPYACDCDTSTSPGVCDVFDFLCFQNAFVGGCP